MITAAQFDRRNRKHLVALSAFCHAAAAALTDTDDVSWLPFVMSDPPNGTRTGTSTSGETPTRWAALNLVIPVDRLLEFYGPVPWKISYFGQLAEEPGVIHLLPKNFRYVQCDTREHEHRSEQIKRNAQTTWFSHGTNDPAGRPKHELGIEVSNDGVIHPLPEANPEPTERDQHSGHCREHFEHPGSSQQERHETRGHEDLVPVVERKLVQRALHRFGSWLMEVSGR